MAWPYRAAIHFRNARYDRGAGVHRSLIPVISIGNLTTGGTGKTPLVMSVVTDLLELGHRPAIVTRGYAAAAGTVADEVLEFRDALPDVPVIVDADRVAGAATAHTVFDATCIVLDDGFQHRRLARNLDIVLIDALNPWGGGQLLPAGRLREPRSALRRADLIVITRCNQVEPAQLDQIEREIGACSAATPIIHATIHISGLTTARGDAIPLRELGFREVLPACGVGNPESFVRLLAEHVGRMCAARRFRDHFRYTPDDALGLLAAARREQANWVVTTRKDWVKLAPLWPEPGSPRNPGGVELVRVDADVNLIDLQDLLIHAIEKATGAR